MLPLPYGTTALLKIGPFVSAADGVTPMADASFVSTYIKLSKQGAAFAAKNSAAACVLDTDGWYACKIGRASCRERV
jgi:hypothetical protein